MVSVVLHQSAFTVGVRLVLLQETQVKKLYNLLSVCTAPSCVSLPTRKFLNMWLNDLVL